MERLKKILFANKGWLLILLMGFVSLMWFKEDLLIAGGDEYILLDPGAFTDFFKYAWNIKLPNAGGILFSIPRLIPMLYFWTFFQSLGLSLVTIEKLWAVLLFVLPGLSMYYFMSQIYNRAWAKISASTLYMFNLFLVVAGPFQGNIKPVLIALPLMLAFFIKGLSNKKESFLKYSVLIGLCSLLYAGSNVNLPTVAIVPFILFLYWLFHLVVERKEFFRTLKFVLATVGGYLFLNLWWITNFLADVIQRASVVREAATFSAVGTTGMVDFFRFLGVWAWRTSHYKMPYFPYAHFYDEPFLLLLSFSIPLLVFLAIFLKPKDKNICFFSLLAVIGLFLAKGSAAPFGFLYKWMWENIPGFWMFREPFSKFTPITLLAYSVLLGFSVELLYQKTSNWQIRRKKGYQLFWLGLIPISTIIIIFIVAYPLLSGEVIWDKWNGSMRSVKAKIPQYWQEMKEYIINHNLQEERLLIFPASGYGMAYNWQHGFSSADGVAVALLPNPTIRNSSTLLGETDLIVSQLFDKLLDRNFKLKSYLSLLNTRYILQENDADWRYSGGQMLPPSKSNQILQNFGLTKVIEFGKFTPDYLAKIPNSEPDRALHDELYEELTNQPALILYKMDNQYFLPHFYIPQRIIYTNGELDSLVDVVGFGDWQVKSGVYLEEIDEIGDLRSRVDEIFVKGRLESKINEEELGEVIALDEEDVFFPYVRWMPESYVYPLVLKKEQFYEWRVRSNPEKLLDKKLFYASKRISEIEKWGREMDLDKAFERYKKKMEEARKLLKEDDWQNKWVLLKNILKTETYLKAHWEKIKSEKFIEDKREKIQGIFEEMNEEINNLKTEYLFSQLIYTFDIPKDGDYQLFVKNEELNRYLRDAQLKLEFLEKEITTPLLSEDEKWISGGSFKLEKGKQKLILTKPQITNLLGRDDWQGNLTESIFVKDKLISVAYLQQAFPKDATIYFKPIESYQEGTLYKISFDYFTSGGEAGIVLIEDVGIKKRELLIWKKWWSTGTDSPRHFEKVFKSTPGAKTAEFYFWGKLEKAEDFKIEFTNVKIERVFEPTIIFHATQYQKPTQTPKITFIKINPTKYKIRIEGAKEPYTLVFSESFHESWKAYIQTSNIKHQAYENILASYFDGEIKEGTHQNVFLDRNVFETWSKKPIPEERHLLVNGYANSWYVIPGDANGAENYEIVIEFWPQRLFYIGLFVSLITFLWCFGYLGVKTIRRYSEKRIFI